MVTSSAVYDHQPALANVNYPVTGCITCRNRRCSCATTVTGPKHCGGTLQTTLPQSCDTAFAQLGMGLGAVSENAEAQAFGFNQVPPLDLPGAVASQFPSVAALTNNAPSQAYSAFGQQNVTASALQMALVAAGIANGGVIMTPHVMAQIRDSQGNLVTSYTPEAVAQGNLVGHGPAGHLAHAGGGDQRDRVSPPCSRLTRTWRPRREPPKSAARPSTPATG